eukprot:TRINITY_DN38351_c0_g1_i1.p1 TRINITY_DN38351_c0_g1~~TRINITY_DN38351_c0_g1_i1.p1  ORF type:complete len:499 (-),score=170.14 TRINITY_DN38351_c0_g1_i1:188-1684(-)
MCIRDRKCCAAMISALSWLPKGAARRNPIKNDSTGADLEAPPVMPDSVMSGAQAEGDELVEKLLEHYDSEEDDDVPASLQNLGKDLMFYDDPADDPYMDAKSDDDSGSEAEEMTILPTDGVLVAARKGEDDFSTIQVYVYEEEDGNVYEHHDITLPAFPLCVEWIGLPLRNTQDRNFLAVGTFEPAIEIWDLDTLNVMEPLTCLGGVLVTEDPREEEKKKKKGKKKKNKPVETFMEGSHTSAVLSLSWNRCHETLLASGSADSTVKVWDLSKGSCAHTYAAHTQEVQSVQWHPNEPTLLLTGSMDGTVSLIDARQPDAVGKWTLPSEVECVSWKPLEAGVFSVSTDAGLVMEFDVRQGAGCAPRFMLDAHSDACTVVAHNPHVEGLFLTASHDKTVKLWDSKSGQPTLLGQNNLDVGAVFSASFWQESPFIVAVGGETGKLKLWDTRDNQTVQKKYKKARDGVAAVPIATTLDEIDSDNDMAEEEQSDSDSDQQEEEI